MRSRRIVPTRAALGVCLPAVLAGFLLAGCIEPPPEPEREVMLDLAAGLAGAEVHSEPGRIDVGSPGARAHLRRGWSWDEETGEGRSFVWSDGPVSELTFFLVEARTMELSFRAFAAPPPSPDAPPQRVEVALNGEVVDSVEVTPVPGEGQIILPGDRLRIGRNSVTFTYRRHLPGGADGPDPRKLGVGWDWIELNAAGLEGGGTSAESGQSSRASDEVPDELARLQVEDDVLFVPYGTQVDYFLVLPEESRFAADRVSFDGDPGSLEILLARDSEAPPAGPFGQAAEGNEEAQEGSEEPDGHGSAAAEGSDDSHGGPGTHGGAAAAGEPGGGEERLAVWSASGGPRSWQLPAGEPGSAGEASEIGAGPESGARSGLVRLSFRAVANPYGLIRGERATGGVVIAAPRIERGVAGAPTRASEGAPAADSDRGGRSRTRASSDSPSDGTGAGADPGAPNLVIFLVDTLRADHLGMQRGGRSLTPRLDAFAAEALSFRRAAAVSSWTKPSVATLLTGLGPLEHGVARPDQGLTEDAPRLAELLREAGYVTAAFTTNAHINEASGFARGFNRFETFFDAPNDGDTVVARVEEWLDGRPGGRSEERRPFFLYVHTIDPHAPYQPPDELRERFAPEVVDPEVGSVESIRAIADGKRPRTAAVERDLAALYAAEVAQADASFGRLLDALEERGLAGDTAVLFLSDHGEAFFEHGVVGHGWDLYNPVLAVPFLLRVPGADAREVDALVDHLDVAPTVLSLAGLRPPASFEGRDLLRALPPPPASSFAYQDYEGRRGASLIAGRWHLIEPLGGGFAPGTELYDRDLDPAELAERGESRPILRGYLRRLLRERLAAADAEGDAARDIQLDEATRERLEALGYL